MSATQCKRLRPQWEQNRSCRCESGCVQVGTFIKGVGRCKPPVLHRWSDRRLPRGSLQRGRPSKAYFFFSVTIRSGDGKMVLNVPKLKFYNGYEVPIFGLGTWKVSLLSFGLSQTSLICDMHNFARSYLAEIVNNTRTDIILYFRHVDENLFLIRLQLLSAKFVH